MTQIFRHSVSSFDINIVCYKTVLDDFCSHRKQSLALADFNK